MMLVIDNFDSFTHNLVQYFGQLGVEQKVVRNNEISPDQALDLSPERILISPGPCDPAQAGCSLGNSRSFPRESSNSRGLPWTPMYWPILWWAHYTS